MRLARVHSTGREGSVKYRLTRALEDHVVREADAVFTIARGLRDDLVARGHPAGTIGLSPNGVVLALFGDPPRSFWKPSCEGGRARIR